MFWVEITGVKSKQVLQFTRKLEQIVSKIKAETKVLDKKIYLLYIMFILAG